MEHELFALYASRTVIAFGPICQFRGLHTTSLVGIQPVSCPNLNASWLARALEVLDSARVRVAEKNPGVPVKPLGGIDKNEKFPEISRAQLVICIIYINIVKSTVLPRASPSPNKGSISLYTFQLCGFLLCYSVLPLVGGSFSLPSLRSASDDSTY
jgi:hypothetical protein